MKYLFTFFYLIYGTLSYAQDMITLRNPSFEEWDSQENFPKYWTYCGCENHDDPDEEKNPVKFEEGFDFRNTASDGDHFAFLIATDANKWEMMGQKLEMPIAADSSYQFSVDLVRASAFIGKSLMEGNKVNYSTPIKLKIWGGNEDCRKLELLAAGKLVMNTRWLSFNFEITPENRYDYIFFESYYKEPSKYPYNGNVLIDHISPIVKIEK